MGYLERMWHFAKLTLGAMHGLELERTVSGDCMNWKALVRLQLPICHWKKENAIFAWLSKDLWRLNTLLVLDTDYIGRSLLTTCLKSLWYFCLLLRIRNGSWLLLMTEQCFKNNESHSSYSLKISRSTHWLSSFFFFFLNAILSIFSPEPHRPHHCESRDTWLMLK